MNPPAVRGLLCRLWLWLFHVRGGFVCPFVRSFAFGVGFGHSAGRWFRFSTMLFRVWFWFGLGRSACAVLSFFSFLGSAAHVGRPSRYLAKKREVCFVSLLCLDSAPRIPALKSGINGRSIKARHFERIDADGSRLSHILEF